MTFITAYLYVVGLTATAMMLVPEGAWGWRLLVAIFFWPITIPVSIIGGALSK